MHDDAIAERGSRINGDVGIDFAVAADLHASANRRSGADAGIFAKRHPFADYRSFFCINSGTKHHRRVNDRRGMDAIHWRSGIELATDAQDLRGPGECKLWMIADEKWPVAGDARGEFSGNDGTRPRLQGSREMFLIFDENEIMLRC